jgi:aspartate racemase
VQATAEQAVERAEGGRIAVFATVGTAAARVYQDEIERFGGTCLPLPAGVQDAITHIIYDQVKANQPVDIALFNRCVATVLSAGASVVVLGCTELSVVYDEQGMSNRPELVDSLRCLTYATITRAGRTPVA